MRGVSKAVLVLVLILLSITVVFSVMGYAAGWEQFHHDVAHLGYYQGSAPKSDAILWLSRDVGAVDASSVAVADGLVFVNCNTSLVALEEASGEVWWSKSVPGDYMNYSSWSSPVYHDGKVFLPGDEARRASDGSLVWSEGVRLPWNVNGCPMVAQGLVFQGDYDGSQSYLGDRHGHYFAFDENTGAQVWKFDVDDNGIAQGTPAYDNGTVFLTAYDMGLNGPGYLYCVDAASGSQIWRQEYPLSLCGSPTVCDGVVYFTTYNFYGEMGDLYAVDESTGVTKWSKPIYRSASTPAVVDGYLYVCGGGVGYGENQVTYCFRLSDSKQLWRTPLTSMFGSWTNSPAVSNNNTPQTLDDLVFVGKPGGQAGGKFTTDGIYCLTGGRGGDQYWQGALGGGSPVIADGVVFSVGNGMVVAYGVPGSVPTPIPIPSPSASVEPSVSVGPSGGVRPSASVEPTPVTIPGDVPGGIGGTATPEAEVEATPSPSPESSPSSSPSPSPSPSPSAEPEGIPLWAVIVASVVVPIPATVGIMYGLLRRRY